MFYYFVKAIEWLNPAIYLIGLSIAVWAFLRSRKCGYLMIAAYFALAVFWLVAWPPIDRTIRAHQAPDISAQTRQKIDAAVEEATQKVLVEAGHPEGIPYRRTLHFPFGPTLLVVGLGLVARKEPQQPIAR